MVKHITCRVHLFYNKLQGTGVLILGHYKLQLYIKFIVTKAVGTEWWVFISEGLLYEEYTVSTLVLGQLGRYRNFHYQGIFLMSIM